LNIAKTPGGVIGQRFCAPLTVGESSGWLTWVVNPVGSLIISSAMIIVGIVTVWHFDWHQRVVGWLESIKIKLKQRKDENVLEAEKNSKNDLAEDHKAINKADYSSNTFDSNDNDAQNEKLDDVPNQLESNIKPDVPNQAKTFSPKSSKSTSDYKLPPKKYTLFIGLKLLQATRLKTHIRIKKTPT